MGNRMRTSSPGLLKFWFLLRWIAAVPIAIICAGLASVMVKFLWAWSVGRYIDPEAVGLISAGFNLAAETAAAAGAGAAFMITSTKIAPSEGLPKVYFLTGVGLIICLIFLGMCLLSSSEIKWLAAWTAICMAFSITAIAYEKRKSLLPAEDLAHLDVEKKGRATYELF